VGEGYLVHRRRSSAIVAGFVGAVAAIQAASADEFFPGLWAQSCSHLSGETFTFHDGDRLKIVDLDCRIAGWVRHGSSYTSKLQCNLDGVVRNERIKVMQLGKRLRIAMGGLSRIVEHCP
jgi:hypothetical protein